MSTHDPGTVYQPKGDLMITMTYSLAMAAGQDAANQAMRTRVGKNPRFKMRWNLAEANIAAATFHRLYGNDVLQEALKANP